MTRIDAALVIMLMGSVIAASCAAAWTIWGKDRTLECDIKVDGKVYKCSTAPKISSDRVIEFRNGERHVEIPIDKEVIVIITFDK